MKEKEYSGDYYLNYRLKNTGQESGIQILGSGIQVMAWILDLYSDLHLNSGPFYHRTNLCHLNTGLVRNLDPHCSPVFRQQLKHKIELLQGGIWFDWQVVFPNLYEVPEQGLRITNLLSKRESPADSQMSMTQFITLTSVDVVSTCPHYCLHESFASNKIWLRIRRKCWPCDVIGALVKSLVSVDDDWVLFVVMTSSKAERELKRVAVHHLLLEVVQLKMNQKGLDPSAETRAPKLKNDSDKK